MELERAHTLIQIKRADPEKRTLRGIASTPTTDRMGDELEPTGAEFKLPFPLLLGHDHNKPIGQVTEARVTPQGIWIVAKIADEGVSAQADEAWRAIRSGLIRGLSVGFIGKASKPLPGGGRRFTKWEIIETSAVTVPANAEAEILEVKRLDKEAVAARPDPDGLPRFPRSLTKADRGVMLRGAARDWSQDMEATAAKGGVKLSAVEKVLLSGIATLKVQISWAEQRINELEGNAND